MFGQQMTREGLGTVFTRLPEAQKEIASSVCSGSARNSVAAVWTTRQVNGRKPSTYKPGQELVCYAVGWRNYESR